MLSRVEHEKSFNNLGARLINAKTRPEVIKLELILKLKIKCNDWLLAGTSHHRKEPIITCPQAANHCASF